MRNLNFRLKTKKSKLNKGFTLVEFLIYMGIIAILIVVLTDILVAIFNTQLSSQSNSQVTQDGRYIYSRLTYDINRAQSISIPANLGSISATLVASISGSTYTYATSSGNLTLTNGGTSYILNSPDTKVSGLSFLRVGNSGGKHTFQINFTVTGKIPLNGRIDSETFQTTAGLR